VLPKDSAQFARQKIWVPVSRLDDVSYRPDAHLSKVPAVQMTCHIVRTHISKASSVRMTRTFRPDLPWCREVSNCYSLHLSGRFNSTYGRISVFNQASGFLSKTQLWEDRCNRPDDVDSHPDALIHKASIVFKIQMSGR
jgi:hypothetical protein